MYQLSWSQIRYIFLQLYETSDLSDCKSSAFVRRFLRQSDIIFLFPDFSSLLIKNLLELPGKAEWRNHNAFFLHNFHWSVISKFVLRITSSLLFSPGKTNMMCSYASFHQSFNPTEFLRLCGLAPDALRRSHISYWCILVKEKLQNYSISRH